jgi:hypothetical protein
LIGARHTGRSANYTIAEDKLLCKTWFTIGIYPTAGSDQTRETYWMRMKEFFDMYRDVGKKSKKGNKILGKPFTMHHCYHGLANEDKWKIHEKLDAAT